MKTKIHINLKNMINFILGAAVATAIILVNLAGLLYHWHREDKKGGKE